MANGEQPRARVAVRSAPTPATAAGKDAAERRPRWWRTALLILLAFALLGAVPILLAGEIGGAWRLHIPGTPDYYRTTPTPARADTDTLPRQAFIAVTAQVYPTPAQTASVATLEPGFPVTITAHNVARRVLWSHIAWDGPTSSSGGNGWILDSATVAYGGQARPIGDLGALAPALGHWAAPQASQIAAVLYFAEAGRLYRLNDTRSFALGSGFSPVLIADLYAVSEAHHTPPSAPVLTALATRSPSSDGVVPPLVYVQLGGANGLNTFLIHTGVSGIVPGANGWDTGSATASGLIQFYATLTGGVLLSQTDRAALIALLQQANAEATATVLGAGHVPAGSFLVSAQTDTTSGWDASASGVLRLASGALVVAVAATGQPTRQAGATLLAGFFAQVEMVAF
ncbi:MAG TPA: hypothetical protein VGR88_04970 [Ktedonobacterales bacterium]|nr:hypothetical protein [Ktedonobacterales bacterium]